MQQVDSIDNGILVLIDEVDGLIFGHVFPRLFIFLLRSAFRSCQYLNKPFAEVFSVDGCAHVDLAAQRFQNRLVNGFLRD